jgi:ADP-heptose:LPS heptosyltransferase
LEALRAAYPDAEIVLIARPWRHTFLTQRPGPIDRVVVIPDGGIGDESDTPQDLLELERFFAEMKRDRFDIAIQMHGGGRNSNPFTQRLEARLTVGLRSPDAIPLDRWMPYVYYQPEILRYLELVSLIGAKPVTLEPYSSGL